MIRLSSEVTTLVRFITAARFRPQCDCDCCCYCAYSHYYREDEVGEFECRSSWPLSLSLLLWGQTRASRSRGFLLALSAPHSPLYIPDPSQQQSSNPLSFGGTFPMKIREGYVFPGPAEPVQVFHDANIHKTLASAQMHFPVYL